MDFAITISNLLFMYAIINEEMCKCSINKNIRS